MSFWKHITNKVAFDQPDMRFELLERESGEPGICSAGRIFLHSKKKHMNPAPIL